MRKLPDEVFTFLSDNIQAGVLWQCSCCQSSTAELSAAVKSLRTELTARTDRVGKTEDVNKLQDNRLDKLEALTKNLEQGLSNNKEEVTASILEEMRERDEKRGNIIIHNVGEPDRSTWEEEKKWDEMSFNNIMEAMQLEFRFERVAVFSRRLGQRAEGRSRPLLVGLHSEEDKNRILQCAKKLAKTHLSSVSIAPDLTRKQREADGGLRDEAVRRKGALSQQDRAKNLHWVVVGRKGMRKLAQPPPAFRQQEAAKKPGQYRTVSAFEPAAESSPGEPARIQRPAAGERERVDGGQRPGQCNGLKILYLNAQSICGKINELQCAAADLNPDILLACETWCNTIEWSNFGRFLRIKHILKI